MKKNGAVGIVAIILGMMLLSGCQGTLPPEGYNCKTDTSWSSSGLYSGNNGIGGSYVGCSDQYRTDLDTGTFYTPGVDSFSGAQTPGSSSLNQSSSNETGSLGQISTGIATDETDGAQSGPGDSYMITTSNSRYIQAEELAGWTAWQLKVARNEIYARHGVIFGEGAIQDHFNTRSWYHGTVDAVHFDSSVFNAYEWANIQTIQAVEAALGQ